MRPFTFPCLRARGNAARFFIFWESSGDLGCTEGAEKGPRVPQGDQKRPMREPQGAKRRPNGAEGGPRETRGGREGSPREPKDTPRGAQGHPRARQGGQRRAKRGPQGPKMHLLEIWCFEKRKIAKKVQKVCFLFKDFHFFYIGLFRALIKDFSVFFRKHTEFSEFCSRKV